MPSVRNGRLILKEHPTAWPIEPGKHTVYDDTQTIDINTVPLNGGLLIKTIVLSIDPLMWARMRPGGWSFKLGEPIDNLGIGVVLRSEQPNVKPGQKVYGFIPYEEYFIRPNLEGLRILDNNEGIPLTVYLGIAGMPGQTGYYGWKEFASAQKGDVVFVTTAAGPVGSLVVQLAKAEGLKVIASAGSDDKVEFVKSLGADVAFNYKKEKTVDVLAKEGPVNIYWDNVGGETLDAALLHAAKGARFIECGMITALSGQPTQLSNIFNIIVKDIKIFGFTVTTLAPKYQDEFYADIPKRIQDGKLKYIEEVTKGLENGAHVLLKALSGDNKGKNVIVVAEDEL